jgi:cytosine/adenosine deaminase-related metal-dependent hydrolase
MAFFREEVRGRASVSRKSLAAPLPRRIILQGRIVTMDATSEIINDGVICIEEKNIAFVGPTGSMLPPDFLQVLPIQTHGTIYPGLVELHNHPAYNAVPLWTVPKLYPSREMWRADPIYKRQVSNPATLLTHHPQEIYPKSVARFVECRALLGGVTTTQGLTLSSLGSTVPYYQGLIRDVEFQYGANWPVATDHINDFANFAEFDEQYGPLINQPLSRFVIHLCEGTDSATRAIFDNLTDASGKPLIGSNLIAIHATALGAAQFASLKNSGGIVWSPLSNFLLYGATTDVRSAENAGVQIALGCDWSPSGTKNLLGELKVAKVVSDHLGDLFSSFDLAAMVTSIPARIMGWGAFLGSIEAGKQADLLVLDTVAGDPYSALISATESDVVAVLVEGKTRVGRASILDPNAGSVELIRIAGQEVVLDLIDSPNHPLANISLQGSISTLADALAHLPDLARTFNSGHSAIGGTGKRFYLHLGMDEVSAAAAVAGTTPIGPGDVDPMQLDAITSVDDPTFSERIRRNSNVPDWLRAEI